MPGKSCFTTLLERFRRASSGYFVVSTLDSRRRECSNPVRLALAIVLLAQQGLAQEFISSNFGTRVADDASHGLTTVSKDPATTGEPGAIPFGTAAPHLVQPAVCQTPDRYVRSVQQAGHMEAEAGTSSDPDRTSGSENSEILTESVGSTQSDRDSGRDLGFPELSSSEVSRLPGAGTAPATEGLGAVLTVISSLAVVLGVFFVTAWFLRRAGAGGIAVLPNDVFELLGRAPLNNRQQVHLVRCGTKLLLVSVTPDSAETLTEIDDPDEVTRLAALCKANQAGSATAAFRQVLHQFARQPAEPGFIDWPDSGTGRAQLPSELEDLHA